MTPKSEDELAETIKAAAGPLRICGGGTRDIGNPVTGEVLSLAGLSGITLYEPGALTLVARAGTPMAEIEAALDAENQRLAFEPMDHRAVLGDCGGAPTIGGVVAANVSGPRRIAVGACRDHVLGVRFVDGQGVITKNGGRVMKNVTGYDLVKLLCGSYGTLGVLSEVSLKVLPKPETSATLVIHDLSLQDSIAAMSRALGSPFEVTGAALHGLPHGARDVSAHGQKTCIRIEGFAASVDYRFDKLRDLLRGFGEVSRVDHDDSIALWREVADLRAFADHGAVTRVSIPPSAAADFADAHWQTLGGDVLLDWGGGLMWFGMRQADAQAAKDQFMQGDAYSEAAAYGLIHNALQHAASPEVLRHATPPASGHATLIKAPLETRGAVSVFQPENPTVTALSAGLRARFDPRGILNPGLMG